MLLTVLPHFSVLHLKNSLEWMMLRHCWAGDALRTPRLLLLPTQIAQLLVVDLRVGCSESMVALGVLHATLLVGIPQSLVKVGFCNHLVQLDTAYC